jgi:methionyl-tRNA synthetase
MPGKMNALRQALGLPEGEPEFKTLHTWGALKPGSVVQKLGALFPRIQPVETAGAEPAAVAPGPTSLKVEAPEGVALVDYADFAKLQLRTARIVQAEPVKGADKLLRLQIDLGSEKRQIVAGIAQHYATDALPGKTIVVVANLKPARIRGVESNGMLLAATGPDGLRLVSVDGDIPAGSKVS